jgi:UDP:flavonoid glycosyltransferase YjiC (YdhE family)
MASVLLIPLGTPGDIQPFVEIGQRLRGLGHEATLVAHPQFAPWAERYRLGFCALGPGAQYQRLLDDPNLWNTRKAHRVFAKKLVLPTLRPLYDLLAARAAADPSLVVIAQTMALGARVAQDRLGLKLVTLHRQPSVMRSLYDSPRVAPFQMGPGVPRALKRLQYRLMDAAIDHTYAPRLNALRAELGLRPVRRIAARWLHSPRRVVCMWPEWFAAPQADWPANVIMAGFDVQTGGEREPPAQLVRFLEAGPKPIVFTAGSGMKHGRAFYRESAGACRLLGRRGLLVTRFADQVPPGLGPDVMHVDYAPFNWLLPRCAAAVHHAGIGTVAQCLAAGIPQLCMPGVVFDTFDNAVRARRLGVARVISQRRYRAGRIAALLRELLESGAVHHACAATAARVRDDDAVGRVCAQVDDLIGHPPGSAGAGG